MRGREPRLDPVSKCGGKLGPAHTHTHTHTYTAHWVSRRSWPQLSVKYTILLKRAPYLTKMKISKTAYISYEYINLLKTKNINRITNEASKVGYGEETAETVCRRAYKVTDLFYKYCSCLRLFSKLTIWDISGMNRWYPMLWISKWPSVQCRSVSVCPWVHGGQLVDNLFISLNYYLFIYFFFFINLSISYLHFDFRANIPLSPPPPLLYGLHLFFR